MSLRREASDDRLHILQVAWLCLAGRPCSSACGITNSTSSSQDRAKPDAELPGHLCCHVPTASIVGYKLCALQAYGRYGGSFLDDVNESGSKKVARRTWNLSGVT